MYFCLRGGQEHRDLRVEQFYRFPNEEVYDDSTYYQYVENGSKNYQGRFIEVGGRNKIVKAYSQPGSYRCPVKILDIYLSKLPPHPKAFYLQWMPKTPEPGKPWYKVTPVGVNPLKNMMPKICQLAGISRYTNHSLRATATTRMFNSGINEKVIAEFSGHKNSHALRQYERTSVEQEKDAGLAIALKGRMENDSTKEKENDEPVDEKPKIDKVVTGVVERLMSAGTMNNCVFNFNF